MKRLAILTSGGDGPGMNAAIRAAVRTATSRGAAVAGYIDGFTGFVDANYVELDDRAVGNIIQRGGTIHGTSRSQAFGRGHPKRAAAQMRADGIERAHHRRRRREFRGALALQDECGVHVAGYPGRSTTTCTARTRRSVRHAVNTALLAIDPGCGTRASRRG